MKEFLEDALKHINSLKEPARIQAAEMFPGFPKAQAVWVKLSSMGGGIGEVIDTLGLQCDYDAYRKQFDDYVSRGNSEAAAICVADFVEFCKEQVQDNFYMFR